MTNPAGDRSLEVNSAADALNPRKIEFYALDASIVQGEGRELLRRYSKINEDDIDRHVQEIRSEAFKVCPYPCIGMYQFLDLSMMKLDVYPEIVQRVAQGQKLLDLGCCLGQEIRQLVLDGAPSDNMYGSDLWGGFFQVGYDLFKDKDTLKTKFIAADVFDDASPLVELAGQMDIIYTGAFFHLFNLEEQEKAATRVVQLLAPRPGSLVVGRQSGHHEAGEYSRAKDKSGRKHFRHNPDSWRDLWERVGRATGSSWSVEADLNMAEFTLASPEKPSEEIQKKVEAKGLRFVVRRL